MCGGCEVGQRLCEERHALPTDLDREDGGDHAHRVDDAAIVVAGAAQRVAVSVCVSARARACVLAERGVPGPGE